MGILLAIVFNALALAAAAIILPGMSITGWNDQPGAFIVAYAVVGAIFGAVNLVIKPVLSLLALPITCLTLGVFAVVINALMLALTAWVSSLFPGISFTFENPIIDTLLGAIIVSIVSALLNRFMLNRA